MGGAPKNSSLHRRILDTLMRRYDTRVMSNVYRADYVECLVVLALGTDWWLTWKRCWDWAAWDIQHISGARLGDLKRAVENTCPARAHLKAAL